MRRFDMWKTRVRVMQTLSRATRSGSETRRSRQDDVNIKLLRLVVLATALCAVVARAQTQTQTQMASLAASMPAGSWAELVTSNISVLNQAGSDGNIIGYAADAAWNPITHQLCFVGNDHIDGNTSET